LAEWLVCGLDREREYVFVCGGGGGGGGSFGGIKSEGGGAKGVYIHIYVSHHESSSDEYLFNVIFWGSTFVCASQERLVNAHVSSSS
jgi:hypothetical protein